MNCDNTSTLQDYHTKTPKIPLENYSFHVYYFKLVFTAFHYAKNKWYQISQLMIIWEINSRKQEDFESMKKSMLLISSSNYYFFTKAVIGS